MFIINLKAEPRYTNSAHSVTFCVLPGADLSCNSLFKLGGERFHYSALSNHLCIERLCSARPILS